MARGTKRVNKKANEAIKEIEINLIQVREEQVQGGLFFEDKVGDERMAKAIKTKTLKIDEIINEHGTNSAIAPMIAKKPRSTTTKADEGFKAKKVSSNIKHKITLDAAKKKAAGLKPGDSVKAKMKKVEEKKEIVKRGKGGFDLWDTVVVPTPNAHPEYVEPFLKRPVTRKQVEDTRPLGIPAVKVAHPGASYQPTEKDHQDAIIVAADQEFAKIDKKEKILQELSYPPELDQLVEDDFFNFSSDEEEEEVDVSDGQDSADGQKAKLQKINTRADLNRKKKLKQTLQHELSIKQQKSLAKQLNKIKLLEKEINSKAQLDLERKKLRDEIKDIHRATKTKKMSRHVFRPAPMEIQLSEEVADNLRSLKPEGNLVKDRFQSLQARNLIETRVPVKRKRKYKQKEVESHDYKRFK